MTKPAERERIPIFDCSKCKLGFNLLLIAHERNCPRCGKLLTERKLSTSPPPPRKK